MKAMRKLSFANRFVCIVCALFIVALACALLPAAALADETPSTETPSTENPATETPSTETPATGGDLAPGTIEGAEPEPVKTVPLYRMYNGFSGEHFYTTVESERDFLTNEGWFYEGIGWQAPETSNTPVYRLYNPVAGDHHYTISAEERDGLIKVGWRDEGIGWYSDDAQTMPVYRQYNPNAWTGTHNFTYSKEENDNVVGAGWRAEGTAWYASAEGESVSMTWFSRTHLFALASCISGSGSVTPGYNTTIEPAKMQRLQSLISSNPSIAFVAINARTGKSVARSADRSRYSASTIKAPYIAALCKYKAPGIGGWVDTMEDVIRWSSNEGFNDLVAAFGLGYESRIANESNIDIDYDYGGAYVDLTPRKLVKLWITIRSFIISSDANSGLFRSLFNRGYFKEGWMDSGDFCGQLYHVGGVEGDVIYAIMSGTIYQSDPIWDVRDAAIAAIS